MEQTLLNEIVARVAAKLAEVEGGEAAPAAADRDDREGLLLLSQEMNDTCRAMLKGTLCPLKQVVSVCPPILCNFRFQKRR